MGSTGLANWLYSLFLQGWQNFPFVSERPEVMVIFALFHLS